MNPEFFLNFLTNQIVFNEKTTMANKQTEKLIKFIVIVLKIREAFIGSEFVVKNWQQDIDQQDYNSHKVNLFWHEKFKTWN